MQKTRAARGIAIGLWFAALAAHAQPTYPTKPLRLIVPFAAGGAADAVARPLAGELTKKLGQTVIVENKAGANSTLGVQFVARAPADGYTLLLGSDAGLALAPNIQPDLGYNAARDFVPIAMLAFAYQVLVVNADSPIRTLQDFTAAARVRPGALTYASIGIGSLSHVSMEALSKRLDATLVQVPYKGVAPAVTDLMGGQVQAMLAAVAAPLPQIKAGKLRAVAFAGPARSPLLPDVPTIGESGYPGFISRGWFGVMAPAGTPPAIVETLRAAVAEIVATPAFQQDAVRANGYDAPQLAPKELPAFIAAELARDKALIDPIRAQLK